MKNLLLRLMLLLLAFFLEGCSTWFFAHYVETRGTWIGRINREATSRTQPTPFTASALVLTVENGPPINVHNMGLFSHTDTRDAKGSKFILVDREDRTLGIPELVGKTVAVKGIIYPWKSAMDSETGEGIGNAFWVLETSQGEIRMLDSSSDIQGTTKK